MRLSVFLCLAALVAVCYAVGPKDNNKAKPSKATAADDTNSDDQNETLEGLPEACRQPVQESDGKKSKDAKEPLCTLRKPYYDDTDQASHFCIVCMQRNDTAAKKPGTGPAAAGSGGDAEIGKQLSQVVMKQLVKNNEFDDNSGLTILIQGVDKPINISKALDDPNNDNDAVLQNVEEVLYIFKNKTIGKQDYKNGEPVDAVEEVDCPNCEQQLKELKPQKLTPQQKQGQADKRRRSEDRQREKNRQRTTTPASEDENDGDNAYSEDANGEQQPRGRQQDARRRQQDEQDRRRAYDEQQRRRPEYAQAAAGYQQPQSPYDRQSRPSYASGSGGASTKSVPVACQQETHFTTEDGICSLHVPQSTELCITCRGDRADAYQIMQSLDSLAQRLSPNDYQYLSQTPDIVLVFDPAPRDNRVFDFQREFSQHDPMVRKLDEAYYFFPNQSVTVQKFDDYGRETSAEPFRTYDDYLRRYQREHEQQATDQDRSQEQQQRVSPYEDAASRDYNQDYYRRQQEQYRQQQLQQAQPAYQQSTDVYGRVYPSAAARPAYDQAQEDRRREQWEAQQRQQRIQPTSTYTPTVYASADYYRTQTTTPYTTTPAYPAADYYRTQTTTPYTSTPVYAAADYYRTQPTVSTTPAYGRTYAYTDRTTQPAYGTMMVSVVTLQPTSTITVTADQYGNVVRPTAYAPYIRPDQRGQRQTMCLVVETTQAYPQTTQAYPQSGQYRDARSPVQAQAVRPVPYAGQPGIYPRNQ